MDLVSEINVYIIDNRKILNTAVHILCRLLKFYITDGPSLASSPLTVSC